MNIFKRLFTKRKKCLTKEEYFKTVYKDMEKAGIDFTKGKSGVIELSGSEAEKVIKENNDKSITNCSPFTVEDFEQLLISLNSKQLNNGRIMTIGCNKQGVLDILKKFYEKVDKTQEEVTQLLERDSSQLEEGFYIVSTNGEIRKANT